jgi:hypothetical protein
MKILKNISLSILSVLIVSSVVYWALWWWEWVENADSGDSLTHTVWNSLVDWVVKKTWSVAETITWVKTFSSSPIVPTPASSTQVANKQYVDDNAVLNTGNETIAWVKTFSSSPISNSPTASWELATKGYVDSISWWANSKTTNGYTYLPNGLIIQWFGQTSNTYNSHNSQITFNFPIAFPNAVLHLTWEFNDPAASPASVSQVNILSNTLSSLNSIYSAQTWAGITWKRRFFAIGY